MEHRWGERVELQHDVRLQVEAYGTLPGQIRNLSLSGVFVAMPIPPLSLWTRVAVYLESGRAKRPRRPRVAQPLFAYVVRRTEDGVALEWCQFAPRAVRKLLNSNTLPPDESRRAQPRAATTPAVVATPASTGR